MNPDIKEEWVAALRSGRYRQAKGVLKRDSRTFCCLGVLCEIAVKHAVIAAPEHGRGDGWRYDGNSVELSSRVRRWAGLTFSEGDEVEIGSSLKVLAAHNDAGCGFKQIADAIEAQL